MKSLRIWFDADNAPHVHVMRPLAEHLRQLGHRVRFTARDRASTCQLLSLYELPYTVVGGPSQTGMVGKVASTMSRALALYRVMRRWHPDVFFGHCSRSLPLASRLMKVPTQTMYDYEWVNPTIFNLLCSRIILPSVIGEERCREAGISMAKVSFYPGLKEQLYLKDLRPSQSPAIATELGLRREKKKILLRPPATYAHYHNPEASPILHHLLELLCERQDVQLILIPRHPDDALDFPETASAEIIVPRKVFDGPSLISSMDMVFSGGGTMAREAAVMGVPSYSYFRGALGRVDEWLASQGRLVLLENEHDVESKVRIEARDAAQLSPLVQDNLVERICREIVG